MLVLPGTGSRCQQSLPNGDVLPGGQGTGASSVSTVQSGGEIFVVLNFVS